MYQNELSRLLAQAKEIVTQNNRSGDVLERSTNDRLHENKPDNEMAKKIRPANSSQGHWFEINSPQSYVKKQKASGSWYRLQAFIQSHSDDELQAMDPTWTRDKES